GGVHRYLFVAPNRRDASGSGAMSLSERPPNRFAGALRGDSTGHTSVVPVRFDARPPAMSSGPPTGQWQNADTKTGPWVRFPATLPGPYGPFPARPTPWR